MESEIVISDKKNIADFTKRGLVENDNAVVLVLGADYNKGTFTGAVVHVKNDHDEYKAGYYSKQWVMSEFYDFDDKIILSNTKLK